MRRLLGLLLVCCVAACAPAPLAVRPVATTAPVPPVSDAARAVGFVDVRTIVPDAVVDLRYATADNFVGEPLYPAGARCLHQEGAPDHDSLPPSSFGAWHGPAHAA